MSYYPAVWGELYEVHNPSADFLDTKYSKCLLIRRGALTKTNQVIRIADPGYVVHVFWWYKNSPNLSRFSLENNLADIWWSGISQDRIEPFEKWTILKEGRRWVFSNNGTGKITIRDGTGLPLLVFTNIAIYLRSEHDQVLWWYDGRPLGTPRIFRGRRAYQARVGDSFYARKLEGSGMMLEQKALTRLVDGVYLSPTVA